MANIVAPASLWTPEGEKSLGRGIQQLNFAEGSVLRDMHVVGQKFNIELRCPKCNCSFKGFNNGTESQQSVSCQCRELRFPARRG